MFQTSHVLPRCSKHTFADLTMESTLSVFCCPKTLERTLFCATSLECLKHSIKHLWKYVCQMFVHAKLKFNKWNMPFTRPTDPCLCLKMSQKTCLQSSLLVNRLAKGGHPTWYRLWKRSLCLRAGCIKLWDWIWLNCLLETPRSRVHSDLWQKLMFIVKNKTSSTKPNPALLVSVLNFPE